MRHQQLFLFCLIFALSLLAAGCSEEKPIVFDVQLDESDVINYAFGGGELGADATYITIRGDGHVTYTYSFPYVGTWPQETLTREHQLSNAETQILFQSLVNAGFFDLKSQETQGADVPRTSIQTSVDNHNLDISFDGTPKEAIHSQITSLIAKIYPASTCQMLELADSFNLMEVGASRTQIITCLLDPVETQTFVLPSEPFFGPGEGLVSILEPGTPVEEWIFQDEDTNYYIWFASDSGEEKEDWRLVDKASYPIGVVF